MRFIPVEVFTVSTSLKLLPTLAIVHLLTTSLVNINIPPGVIFADGGSWVETGCTQPKKSPMSLYLCIEVSSAAWMELTYGTEELMVDMYYTYANA